MMKTRVLALFLSLTLLVPLLASPLSAAAAYDLPADLKVSAKSALVVSLGTTPAQDMAVFEREADAKRPPAALVRVMVGALALEMIRDKGLDMDRETGTYTAQCDAAITGTGLSVAQMKIGETWTLRALLTGTLILSAADACVSLAFKLAGSERQFVAKMNEKAKALGCTGTNFVNVHGLDTANQYTTARDMYRMTRYAMDFPEFADIMKLSQFTIKPVSGGQERVMVNTNAMVRPSTTAYYSPLAFGKTGATDRDGVSLASVARDSGYEYMVIALCCTGEGAAANTAHYTDTKTLYRWAFNAFTYKTLLSRNEPVDELPVTLAWDRDKVTLVPKEEFSTVVANDLDASAVMRKITLNVKSAEAPVKKGQVFGKVELIIKNDQKIGEVELVASESVEKSQIMAIWASLRQFLTSPWFFGGLAVLLLLLILYVILNILHNRKRRRRRMKRVKKYK